jgi:predicted Rossmann fold nucleotide-binding protein DprA/Smf involved in DNA uptake
MKLLISGSREASPKMLEFAKLITTRAWYRGYEIIVGDAEGIDKQVVQTAEKFNAHYRAYGITRLARNGAICYQNVKPILAAKRFKPHAAYFHRDRYMVSESDIVICIWNGRSEGTRRVYDFAVASGKRAYLYNGNKLIEKFEPEERHG